MAAGLQRIVDDLAVRLGRPVLVEDHRQRVVAYSEQTGPMDEIRRNSILRRTTTPEVRERMRAAGIFGSADPVRVPPAPELGLLPRVCVPVHHGGSLLGFLWFIDAGPAMTDESVACAAGSVRRLALALHHESLAAGLASQHELEAVRDLLLADAGRAAAASRALIEAGGFPQAGPVTAVVVRPVIPPGGEPDEELRTGVEEALLAARRGVGGALHLVRYDHGVLLVSDRADRARDLLAAAGSGRTVIGAGEPRAALASAAASYAEALQAAEIAARVPALGPAAEWARLGVYRLLAALPATSPGDGRLHPGLARLLADESSAPLLETLEVYLDLAGNAHATARRLALHRTSLYYRLRRVEELADTDLKNGDERLALHLGLKLARLSGAYPALR
ncbi:PucR family transcriptional regulator [Bailinhaonella thermotolerans]|nr:helix-turn-helix domain-containing protein [Bailinhaonella thermotolerans]